MLTALGVSEGAALGCEVLHYVAPFGIDSPLVQISTGWLLKNVMNFKANVRSAMISTSTSLVLQRALSFPTSFGKIINTDKLLH